MSIRSYETGLSQVAAGMASLCMPTRDGIGQLLSDLRSLEVAALRIEDSRLAATVKEAEDHVRSLLVGTAANHADPARALHRVGSILLLRLLELAAKANATVETDSPTNKKALVVDDSRVAAVALSNALVARQYLVRSVATMEDALDALTSFAPTTLVSDVHMPNLDVGILCRKFRELSQGRAIRIVLISSMAGDEVKARLEEIKPDAFVPKTAGAATVADRVAELWP
jgi:CheY-like chemotaxis protein